MYFITLPNFELNVHMAIRPVLKDIPFAITNGADISAANNFAMNSGINKGVKNFEARKKSPLITIEKAKPYLYENFSKEFYRILSLFTGIIEPVDYRSAFVDFQSTSETHRTDIIQSVVKKLESELEIDVAVGEGSSKTVAQVACGIISPKGILSIPKEQSESFLRSIPLSLLPGIGRRSAALLWGLGIKTCQDLSKQSHEQLFMFFGKSGLTLKDRSQGIDNRSIELPHIKKSISKTITFGHSSKRWHYLVSMLHFCLSKIERDLHASCQWSSSFQIHITCDGGSERHLTFHVYKNNGKKLYDDAEYALKKLVALQPSQMLRSIQIRATRLQPVHNSSYFFKTVRTKTSRVHTNQSSFSNLFAPLRVLASA